ncbi:amidohydrolase [Enterocloster asparagiformis]|uniref:amidohydrolase n=1 Tax=Enterocloster asparagiformis TaxID=333367 RepID=UPI002A8382AD|nr:amidohydrolase [Enterocloster asparagiformis]
MYDLILKNANVITMDSDLSKAQWLAVADGKIREIGRGECPLAAARVIDLDGKTVLPGLFDSHMHMLNTGSSLYGISAGGVGSIQELLERVEAEALKQPRDRWIFVLDYLAQSTKENRFPTCWELDTVSHGHPVLVSSPTAHANALNSAALKIVDISGDLPGVVKENGRLTGQFLSDESAMLARTRIFNSLPPETLAGFFRLAAKYAVEHGVTTIQTLEPSISIEPNTIPTLLDISPELPVNIVLWNQTFDVGEAIRLGLPRVGGCLCLDGASFEHTAAMYTGYVDAPHLRGVLYYNDATVYKFVSEAHQKGLPCTMHAVGERAIDQLLWTYKRVFAEQGRKNIRHRLEHMCFPTEEQIQMATDMEIIISMQPGFSYLWDVKGASAFRYVVGDEVDRMDPYHKIIATGGIVCGGSDSPVTPIDSLTYIAHCVRGSNPVRNISLTEALKMFTINGAYSCNQEACRGSIEHGKLADFTVIDRDPYEYENCDELFKMRVEMTIVNGRIVYDKSQSH